MVSGAVLVMGGLIWLHGLRVFDLTFVQMKLKATAPKSRPQTYCCSFLGQRLEAVRLQEPVTLHPKPQTLKAVSLSSNFREHVLANLVSKRITPWCLLYRP